MARRLEPWQVKDVRSVLEAYSVERLRRLLDCLEGDSVPMKKAEYVARLEDHVEGRSLLAVLDRLTDIEVAAVAEVVHGPSRELDVAGFRVRHGELPRETARDGSPLNLLLYEGRVIPPDLKERLRALEVVDEPNALTIETFSNIPDTITINPPVWMPEEKPRVIPVTTRKTDREAIRDLPAVLRLVDAGKVSVSPKKKRPSPAVQNRIVSVLSGGDLYGPEVGEVGPIRGFAWPMLLQAGGLVNVTKGRLGLTPAGRKALSSPPEETLRRLWTRWLTTRLLDELSRVEGIRGQAGKGKRGLTAVASRRSVIEIAMRDCPSGQWIKMNEFWWLLQAGTYGLEVSRSPWTLYLSSPSYGSLGYDGFSTFDLLEGRYTLAFLFEYAATVGLVDVAYAPPEGIRSDFHDCWGTDEMPWLSRYDGLLAIRINPLGAWILGLADEYRPAPEVLRADLTVLPTLDVVVTTKRPEPVVELTLDRFGERTSPNVWRLTREKMLAATSEGHPPAELFEFLRGRSSAEIPETVLAWLADAEERAEALSVEATAVLVVCRDAALAALVANDRSAGKLCRPCGDRHLAVPVKDLPRFRKALAKLGYPLPPEGEE